MPTPIPIYRYPLDGTGTSPDNLVIGEQHLLSSRAVRCVAPTYGGFFAESVVVTDLVTNLPLIRGVDYNFGELFEFPTGRYGKEIFGLVVITKPNVSNISLRYQALGGDYSYSMDAIIAMIDNLDIGERPVAWGDIISRPAIFDPASHLHDIGDVYGFEYIVHSLERIRAAVLLGDVASHDEIYRYIDRSSAEQAAAIAVVADNLSEHEALTNNPHSVTKAQVGLGSVQNYGIAAQADMDSGISNSLYLTPLTVYKNITDRAVTPMNTHIGRTNNPHSVTKAQVGLGSVENYPIATSTIALAGTSNVYYMTPLQTANVVAPVILSLNNHTANTSNPHSVTKAQVGLGSVQNYGIAAQADMDAGTANNLYLTPATVYKNITDRAVTPLSNHIGNVSNPHATTKAQVGLGSVENYPISTSTISLAGISNAHYMTPLQTATVVSPVSLALSNHTSNVSNPHATTKAQVGLGSVQNYGIATQADMDAGTANNLYLTPNTVYKNITDRAVTPLSNHTSNISNPHSTTKAQVGLGSVQNYGIATQVEAETGTSNSVYMTPLRTTNMISPVSLALSNHTGNTSNPHSVTKAQVGLGSVQNYNVATQAEAEAGTSTTLYVTPFLVNKEVTKMYNDGAFDSRYIRYNTATDGSVKVVSGIAYVYANTAWRQFWPPQWQ